MKKILKNCLIFSSIIYISNTLTSCKGGYEHNEIGMQELNSELQDKFGKDAYYTIVNISAAGDEMMGYTIFVDKTEKEDDLRQERWVLDGGAWRNAGYANMQIDVNNPKIYKFQLDKEVKLSQLGKLIEESKQKFIEENKGSKPVLRLAQVNTNTTVRDEASRYQYTIQLFNSGEQAGHSYTYDRNGKLIQSN